MEGFARCGCQVGAAEVEAKVEAKREVAFGQVDSKR
jgi:hypothetical protein